MAYSFAVTVIRGATINISNFVQPEYQGGFNRDEFWDKFIDLHVPKDEDDLMAFLFDLARSHWSPKVENWPGMRIVVDKAGTNVTIDLVAGKSSLKPFHRGKGKHYSWTRACLATAGIFEQVFRKNAGCDTNTINGHWNGATQYLSTVEGFAVANYDEAVKSFKAWLASVGVTPREAQIDQKVNAATHKAIASRTKANSAFSFLSAMKYCTGAAFDEGDQIQFTV